MTVTLGAMIGENEATSSPSVTVTLTAGVPAGDDTTTEGLIVVTAKKQTIPSGDHLDYTDAQCEPAVSDSASPAPPYNLPNQLLSRIAWQGTPGVLVGIGQGAGVSGGPGDAVLFNGAWFYECLAPLSLGDTITFDYSHNPHTITWLGARVYRVTGFRGDNVGAPGYAAPQPGGGSSNGFNTNAECTFGDNEAFTKFMTFAGAAWDFDDTTPPYSTPGAYTWTGPWVGSPLAETDHWSGTVTNGGVERPWRIGYAFLDLIGVAETDGHACFEGYPHGYDRSGWSFMYSEDGPGWPIPAEPVGIYLKRTVVG